MITLKDLGYIRSGTADLAAQLRFAQDIVGLELVAIEDRTAYLRADDRHHCVAFVEGETGALSHGFVVADTDALDAAESELEAAGVKVARGTDAEAHQRRVRHSSLTTTVDAGTSADSPRIWRAEATSQAGCVCGARRRATSGMTLSAMYWTRSEPDSTVSPGSCAQ